MAELESPDVMPQLITYLSSLLQRVAESNDLNPPINSQKVSVFHGLSRPTISIQSYLERIFKYANCSPSCFVVAYVYLDRFAHRQPTLPLTSFNVHRLLITSVMVAAKFMDDMYYNNAYYAKVGGISTVEMKHLEVDFLFGVGFHLNVTPNTFHTYCSYLQREALSFVKSSSLNFALSSLRFNEESETSHQKQQLAVSSAVNVVSLC
ncbi:cyclin-U4-1 [Mercurialis annua]|uniref:cyclin-U4-1 n=1 Tax=Mercurialis annua TaxID=3986 RepID=UPI00215F185E|nr:cyclin-U4-1 [Mercurialis annua]